MAEYSNSPDDQQQSYGKLKEFNFIRKRLVVQIAEGSSIGLLLTATEFAHSHQSSIADYLRKKLVEAGLGVRSNFAY